MSVEGPGKPGHNPLSDAIKDGFEVLAQAHQAGQPDRQRHPELAMRDEDLADVPKTIEAWKIKEFLEGLGIKHKDAFEMVVGTRSVEIGVYASDGKGMRYVGVDGKTAAQHRISIPLVGSWEKPADLADVPEITRCDSELSGLRCERQPLHTGEHAAWDEADDDGGILHTW